MTYDQMNKPISDENRQKLYRFLINKPEAVKTLIRHLTNDEGCSMIGFLSNADDRKSGRPIRSERERADAEIEAILA